MNDLLQQLIGLSPGLVAGLRGNGQGMQAFMDAYQRTHAQLDQQARQRQGDKIALEDRQRQIQQQTNAQARQGQQDQYESEDRRRRQAMDLLGVSKQLGDIGGAQNSPESAAAAIDALYGLIAPSFGGSDQLGGVRDTALDTAQQTITARQKRQVSEFVEQAMKTDHVANNPDSDPVIQGLPDHIVKLIGTPVAKLSDLQKFAQLPVGKPVKTATPRQAPMAGSFEDYVTRKYGEAPTPEQVIEARKTYTDAGREPDKPNANAGAYPPQTTRRMDQLSKGFDLQPIVKRVQTMAEAVTFANSMDPNTTNSADDQAMLYAFAKAMDPDSVVREGEYATVQKYAQSWAQTFGFDLKRMYQNGPFLTPDARANMKRTIASKFAAARGQYENVRKEYGRRMERITGKPGGVDELIDYGAAFPGDTTGPRLRERRKVNGVLAEWDGTGWLPVKP